MLVGFQRVSQVFISTVKFERRLCHTFTPIHSILVPIVLVRYIAIEYIVTPWHVTSYNDMWKRGEFVIGERNHLDVW
jgi:hypothetical protein